MNKDYVEFTDYGTLMVFGKTICIYSCRNIAQVAIVWGTMYVFILTHSSSGNCLPTGAQFMYL